MIGGWVMLVRVPVASASQLGNRLRGIVLPMAVWTAIYLAAGRVIGTVDRGAAPGLAGEALLDSVPPASHLWFLYPYAGLTALFGAVTLLRRDLASRHNLASRHGPTARRRPTAHRKPTAHRLIVRTALLGVGAAVLGLGGTAFHVASEAGSGIVRPAWLPVPYQIAYCMMGAVLLAARPPGRRARTLWAAAAIAGAAATWWAREHGSAVPYGSPSIALAAICAVRALTGLRLSPRAAARARAAGALTFHVYLGHRLFIQLAALWLPPTVASPAAALAVTLAITALALAASAGFGCLTRAVAWRGWLG
jgi:surface polysaccharide O-acyltransferase-like enzyme